jgi:hypothetical protein
VSRFAVPAGTISYPLPPSAWVTVARSSAGSVPSAASTRSEPGSPSRSAATSVLTSAAGASSSASGAGSCAP